MHAQARKADAALPVLELRSQMLQIAQTNWEVAFERAAILWTLMDVLRDRLLFCTDVARNQILFGRVARLQHLELGR